MEHAVIFLPGIVAPAAVRYAPLLGHLPADVELPPPPDDPPPPWMAKRPAGIGAFTRALRNHHVDEDRYRAFGTPVYFSRGSRTHPRWEAMQERLARAFPDFTGEVFDGLHHLDPAHQREPARAARMLSAFWARAEWERG